MAPVGVDLEPIEAVAKASASTGALRMAIEHARSGAAIAGERERWAREVWCLQAATRFGDRTTTNRLAELVGIVKGPFVAAVWMHATALATGDADGLLAVSQRYEEMGDLLPAVDAAAQAAAQLRRVDRRGTAFGAVRRSRELAEMCGTPHTPAMAAAEAPPEFTGREREVIMLAGKGLTNREIAERLQLSVRTVEGHLYRAAARVGARNRNELARTICDDLGDTG